MRANSVSECFVFLILLSRKRTIKNLSIDQLSISVPVETEGPPSCFLNLKCYLVFLVETFISYPCSFINSILRNIGAKSCLLCSNSICSGVPFSSLLSPPSNLVSLFPHHLSRSVSAPPTPPTHPSSLLLTEWRRKHCVRHFLPPFSFFPFIKASGKLGPDCDLCTVSHTEQAWGLTFSQALFPGCLPTDTDTLPLIHDFAWAKHGGGNSSVRFGLQLFGNPASLVRQIKYTRVADTILCVFFRCCDPLTVKLDWDWVPTLIWLVQVQLDPCRLGRSIVVCVCMQGVGGWGGCKREPLTSWLVHLY